ncbi:MAG: cytochrome c biogenesis protein CcsA, partial [Bacteroidetes bacterium]|nr:cytochrome c biogenesis protein CcsA [Bacteroidota bacterium]
MLGSVVLSLALASCFIAMIMYYLNFRGYKNTLNYARIAYHSTAVLVIIASVLLWRILLTHSYQYEYVFSYSSNDLSLGFLLSTFWGGQEGSFMLWLLFTTIIGIFLQNYTSKRDDLEPRVMAVFSLALFFILIMVSPWFKNPFEFIWTTPVFIDIKYINPAYIGLPQLSKFAFSDSGTGQQFIKMTSELYNTLMAAGISVNQFIINGKGLNPQLLNFWMQIHPPILFVGFALSTVPFTFAIAALMKNDYTKWIKQAFPWVLAGAGVLGLAIMLGGYWAYEMLGWGGYWAWDPVENSSLIPWLVSVAAIHTMLVQRKSQSKGGVGRFLKTNLILGILIYILVLYSTFLTRSGVLGDASVHSFVDPGTIVYLFLLIFIVSFLVLGFGSVLFRWKALSKFDTQDENLLSRELALFTAAVVMSASALIVLVGTSAPIFGQSIETTFYVQMHLPIAIIIGLLNGLSLLIKWKKSNWKEVVKKGMFSILASLFLTILIIVLGGVYDLMLIILSFSSSFLLFVNLEIAMKIVRGNKKMLGAYVSHIGMALFLLGIIGSAGYSIKQDADLIKGIPTDVLGYKMLFTSYKPIDNNTKYAFRIDINKGDEFYTAEPVMYVSDYTNSIMRVPSIVVGFTRDIYISPLGFDDDNVAKDHLHKVSIEKGKSIDIDGVKFTFNEFNFPAEIKNAMMAGKDFKIGVRMTAEKDNMNKSFELFLENKNSNRTFTTVDLKDFNLKVKLENLVATGKIDLSISDLDEKDTNVVKAPVQILSIEASIKPFINLVWIGVVVMFIGFIVSASRRLQ